MGQGKDRGVRMKCIICKKMLSNRTNPSKSGMCSACGSRERKKGVKRVRKKLNEIASDSRGVVN